MKLKLLRADWIIIIAFVMFIGTHICTNFLVFYHISAAEQIGESKRVVEAMEVNPIARYLYLFNDMRYIFQLIILPAFYFGSYYYLRKKYYKQVEILETVSVMVFMAAFINFTNDLAIVIALLVK